MLENLNVAVQRRRSRCPVIESTLGDRSSHQYPETPYRLDASPDGIYFFKDQNVCLKLCLRFSNKYVCLKINAGFRTPLSTITVDESVKIKQNHDLFSFHSHSVDMRTSPAHHLFPSSSTQLCLTSQIFS